MVFRLHIHCDNAVFADDPNAEVARILEEQVIPVVRSDPFVDNWAKALRDMNGNSVGFAAFYDD